MDTEDSSVSNAITSWHTSYPTESSSNYHPPKYITEKYFPHDTYTFVDLPDKYLCGICKSV